jgi:hypothetical protein
LLAFSLSTHPLYPSRPKAADLLRGISQLIPLPNEIGSVMNCIGLYQVCDWIQNKQAYDWGRTAHTIDLIL